MSKEFKSKSIRKNSRKELPKLLNIFLSVILILIIITIVRIIIPLLYIPNFWYNYSYEWTIEPIFTWNTITWTDLNWNEFEYKELQAWDITMMDRNLWATTNDITNTWSYWYYYQRWNNYWFSQDNINVVEHKVESTEKWYYSDKFISFSDKYEDWLVKSNDNLRWSKSDKYEDKQGPCPNWWHIPTIDERNYVLENTMFDKLLIPEANSLIGNGSLFNDWTNSKHAWLWTSSKVSPLNLWYIYYLYDLPKRNSDGSYVINPDKHLSRWIELYKSVTKWDTVMANRSMGFNIRCFKNK